MEHYFKNRQKKKSFKSILYSAFWWFLLTGFITGIIILFCIEILDVKVCNKRNIGFSFISAIVLSSFIFILILYRIKSVNNTSYIVTENEIKIFKSDILQTTFSYEHLKILIYQKEKLTKEYTKSGFAVMEISFSARIILNDSGNKKRYGVALDRDLYNEFMAYVLKYSRGKSTVITGDNEIYVEDIESSQISLKQFDFQKPKIVNNIFLGEILLCAFRFMIMVVPAFDFHFLFESILDILFCFGAGCILSFFMLLFRSFEIKRHTPKNIFIRENAIEIDGEIINFNNIEWVSLTPIEYKRKYKNRVLKIKHNNSKNPKEYYLGLQKSKEDTYKKYPQLENSFKCAVGDNFTYDF